MVKRLSQPPIRRTILADSSAIVEHCLVRVVGKPAIASTALYLLVDSSLFLDFFLGPGL